MRLQNYINKSVQYDLNHRKFHEHLININEIFDKDVKLEKPTWDGTYFSINFNINDELYTFKAKENDKGEFSILFWASGLFDIKGSKRYSGDVFSAVKKSLQLLIKKKDVDRFWFNSDEPKLIRLYDGILKRMIKEFKGFELEQSIVKNGIKFWVYKRRQMDEIPKLHK